MAHIKIKGRLEPITVSNERAIRLKALRFGDPYKKLSPAPLTDVVDLGDWSGEIGRISEVELDRRQSSVAPQEISENELRKTSQELAKLKPIKVAGKQTIWREEQYLQKLGIINIDPDGNTIIKDPGGYTAVQKQFEILKQRSSKKEYATKKGLEELATSMSI